MRALIVGCSAIGAMMAEKLVHDGHRVTILDRHPSHFGIIAENVDVEQIVGDGSRTEDLVRAGVREAELVLASTPSDTANALIAQLARHTFQTNKVVCVVEDPQLHDLYRSLGMDAICPSLRAFELVQRAVRS